LQFAVGPVASGAGENGGSRRVFAVAKRHGLDDNATPRLFCEHYADVLATPEGSDHANIRAFIDGGWASVSIDAESSLVERRGE
jgi:hypothetical protein